MRINLDAIPVKYEVFPRPSSRSESQERMAVVIAPEIWRGFGTRGKRGVEASVIAEVTGEARLAMTYRGDVVLAIDRAFIDTPAPGKRLKREFRLSITINILIIVLRERSKRKFSPFWASLTSAIKKVLSRCLTPRRTL